MKRLLLLFTLTLAAATANAVEESLLMLRSTQSFPETMLQLQQTLVEYGYTVSRVQRVDIGLTTSGFQTDKYRVVFFGKPDEVRKVSARYPQLTPFLPLKMTLFAEQDETVLVAMDPTILEDVVGDKSVHRLLRQWKKDILSIMDRIREE